MIIYEGEELVIHRAEGDTDYLLVTFVGAWETHDATRTFLAEPPVRKNNISCLGITSKVDYWYISPETEHVLALIRDIAADYSRVILFGMSMGGYAALAFSRALNADIVFTGAPKWSLDPAECDISEDYVLRNFRDGMQGMGLRPDRIQGQIYIACDPKENTDTYHLKKIVENIKNVHYIPTPYAGHVVMRSLTGTVAFKKLIDALLTGNPDTVTRVVSDIRRKNPENLKTRLATGNEKHPLLCYHILAALFDSRKNTLATLLADERLICFIIWRLIRKGHTREAQDLFVNAISLKLTGSRARSPRNIIAVSDSIALSVHGYVISWDVGRAIFHGCSLIIPDNSSVPVLCHETGGEKYASVMIRNQRFYIRQENECFALTPDLHDQSVLRFTPILSDQTTSKEKQNDHAQVFALQTQNGYGCFLPNYENNMSSPNLLDWEILALCPISAPASSAATPVINDNLEDVSRVQQNELTQAPPPALRL